MDSVNIPLVPQWNLISSCTSTPDDGFLYIGSKCINYVSRIENNLTSPQMKVFHTRQRVKCIDCDPNWSKKKYFAALVDDNSVQIWDFDDGKAKIGHKAHIKPVYGDGDGPPPQMVRLCFLRNRNVLSIDSACLVIYCILSNTFIKKKRIIPVKHEVSIIKGSPYDDNIFATGTTRGLILLCNLKAETIIYTLRGHDTEITSLSWMAMNISPLVSGVDSALSPKEGTPKKPPRKNLPIINPELNDDIFDIYDYDYLENEFGAPVDDTVHSEEKERVVLEKTKDEFEGNENFNFAEECQNLKDDINALKHDFNNSANISVENNYGKLNSSKQVTLKDCHAAGPCPNSNSSISCESNNDSMEMIDHSSDETNSNGDHELTHKVDVHRHAENDIQLKDNDENLNNIYLASGSHESVVYIWDTKSGSSVDKLQLKNSSQNSFIEICWLNENIILTNTRSGDLVQWQRNKDSKKKLAFKQDKRVFLHRGVVSLCKLTNSEIIWTISFYREITCEDIKENKILAKYSCASTNIAAIKERPDDMNKIAFACADRRIGILNVSNISYSNILIENCTNKIESAVMALSWSTKDSLLAFATMEGRVGIIDTDKPSNVPFIMNPFSGKPIYSLQWEENNIYACGNKKIAIYDGNKKKKDPYILENITDATAISVRGNFLLVGKQAGNLELYKRISNEPIKYEFLANHLLSTKYISEINWSPIRLTHCAVVSLTNKVWILCLTNDGIFTLERTLTIGDNTSGNASVKWSNRNENILLTCGFDGAVRIWDISNTSDKHIFLKQFNCPMLCGLFSPIEENIVICAGKATSIEMFDMRTERIGEFSRTVSKRNKDKPLSDVQWATKMISTGGLNSTKERRRNKRRSNVKNHNVSTTEESESKEMTNLLEKLDIKNKNEEKQEESSGCGALFLKNHATMLHLTAKESNKDSLENLMKVLQENNHEVDIKISQKQLLSKKLFGTKSEVKQLLDDELRNHHSSGTKSIANILIPQIKGDLKQEILKCIQIKKLNEWHISLAPTISYEFWKKCCIAYANQLIEAELVLQASTYLLACHNIKEVINIFVNGNYFREAWIIGKLYREPDDPILHSILDKWIGFLEMNGHFEGASFICALSGQFEKCHKILNKRQRPSGEHSKILDILTMKLEETKQ